MALNVRDKPKKRNMTYYLDEETIEFIEDVADSIPASRNETLTAIIDFYRKAHKKGLKK